MDHWSMVTMPLIIYLIRIKGAAKPSLQFGTTSLLHFLVAEQLYTWSCVSVLEIWHENFNSHSHCYSSLPKMKTTKKLDDQNEDDQK